MACRREAGRPDYSVECCELPSYSAYVWPHRSGGLEASLCSCMRPALSVQGLGEPSMALGSWGYGCRGVRVPACTGVAPRANSSRSYAFSFSFPTPGPRELFISYFAYLLLLFCYILVRHEIQSFRCGAHVQPPVKRGGGANLHLSLAIPRHPKLASPCFRVWKLSRRLWLDRALCELWYTIGQLTSPCGWVNACLFWEPEVERTDTGSKGSAGVSGEIGLPLWVPMLIGQAIS